MDERRITSKTKDKREATIPKLHFFSDFNPLYKNKNLYIEDSVDNTKY